MKKSLKDLSENPIYEKEEILKNFNDLEFQFSQVKEYWDFNKNIIKINEITSNLNKKAYWICKQNHSYEQLIKNALKRGFKCPICANQQFLEGYNDLKTKYPKIASEFDSKKNNILPQKIGAGSHKKVWWKHTIIKNSKEYIHEWETTINSRTSGGMGCPICSGQKILTGYNDLATLRPDVVKEWNYEKNGELKPEKTALNSPKKVWWKHEVIVNNKKYIHEWESVVYSRTSGNKGCPYCGGRKVLKGFNDFQSHYPELAKEWDYQLNNCKPDEITYGSNKKIHWICSKNHKYEAYVPDRRQGDGCPICSLKLRTSKPEKAIYFYLKKLFPDSICNYKQNWLGRKELDIYIPSLNLAIEYDGQKWHKDKEKDILKNKICEENNVTLIRIREPKCPDLNYGIYYTLDSTYIKNLDKAIYYIIDYINKKYNLKLFLEINILNDIEQITKLIE